MSASVAIEIDFDVFVDAECHNTQFTFGDMSELEKMYTTAFSSTEKQYTFAEPLDEVSSQTGQGAPYCGERTYTIEIKDYTAFEGISAIPSPSPTSMSADPGKSASVIFAAALTLKYDGTYQAELRVGLKDYPGLIQPATFPLEFYIFGSCDSLVKVNEEEILVSVGLERTAFNVEPAEPYYAKSMELIFADYREICGELTRTIHQRINGTLT